jgi:hypothetical protein
MTTDEALQRATDAARNWTQAIAEEGDTYFMEWDGRIVAARAAGDDAALREVLTEVAGWMADQAADRSLEEDEEGRNEYDRALDVMAGAGIPVD